MILAPIAGIDVLLLLSLYINLLIIGRAATVLNITTVKPETSPLFLWLQKHVI